MTNAATRFQPDISGSAVPNGFVGEMFGTQRSGTNGFSYSDKSSTLVSGSATTVLSRSLNKGIYIVSFVTRQANSSSAATLYRAMFLIGGTVIAGDAASDSALQTSLAQSGATHGTISATIPFIISADSVTVSLQAVQPGQTASGTNSHEWWIYRIG